MTNRRENSSRNETVLCGHHKVSDCHLPLDNKLLRDVYVLHLVITDSKHGAQAICRLAVVMPTLSEKEVALVTNEWKVYQAGQVNEKSATRRVYHYWAGVFQEKSLQGECKYSVLQKLVKGLLCLAHANADVERSLSANKKTVTSDRTSLGELTVNGLCPVEDHVKVSSIKRCTQGTCKKAC